MALAVHPHSMQPSSSEEPCHGSHVVHSQKQSLPSLFLFFFYPQCLRWRKAPTTTPHPRSAKAPCSSAPRSLANSSPCPCCIPTQCSMSAVWSSRPRLHSNTQTPPPPRLKRSMSSPCRTTPLST